MSYSDIFSSLITPEFRQGVLDFLNSGLTEIGWKDKLSFLGVKLESRPSIQDFALELELTCRSIDRETKSILDVGSIYNINSQVIESYTGLISDLFLETVKGLMLQVTEKVLKKYNTNYSTEFQKHMKEKEESEKLNAYQERVNVVLNKTLSPIYHAMAEEHDRLSSMEFKNKIKRSKSEWGIV
jgi:hypothetical protein